ncbi:MAG TPA: hypothetical protein PKD91_02280 [Bacteroidia bacterium]|nr:hypothetical protein [Bacteroidia bacterium]
MNWVDGMKMNKEHFEQTDSYIKDLARDVLALQLNDLNYGLCLPVETGSVSLNIKISIDPSKIIRVQLISCRAITSGGSRIEFGHNQSLKLNADSDKLLTEYHFDDTKDKLFYVIISTNIHARIPVGQPDAEETPPRFPFVSPEYQLQILPESQINISQIQYNSLIVGCLAYHSGKMRVIEDFIPPCTMVNCYPLLQESYFKLGNLLGETGKNIAITIDKIHGKSQSTSLVKSCLSLCNVVSDFVADNMGSYRWIIANQPPVYMLDCFLRLAYKISITLNNLPVKDKEELINYICEWVDEVPADINEKINKLIRAEYQHNDISTTLNIADEFMQMTHNIFLKLSQLDFIGKKKGERAFVQEKPVVTEQPPPDKGSKGWSFIAE